MSNKGEKLALAAVEKAADTVIEQIDERRDIARTLALNTKAAELMGSIRVIRNLARSMDAQSLQALRHFADEKLYQGYGYSSMDEFLDKYENSPMSHSQFHAKLNLLDAEGEDTFNALNSMKVPASARKLLAGEIKIDGTEMIVGNQRIPTADTGAVVQIIKTLSKEIAANEKKLERGAADNLKLKEKLRNAEVTGTSAPLPETVTGAILTLGGAHTHLHNVLRQLPLVDRKRFQKAIGDQAQWNQSVLLQLFKIDDAPDADAYEIPDDLIEGME